MASNSDIDKVSANGHQVEASPAGPSSEPVKRPYVPGVAPIKAEYLLAPSSSSNQRTPVKAADDDAAEQRTGPVKRGASEEPETEGRGGAGRNEKPSDIDGQAQPGDEDAITQAGGSSEAEPPKKLKGAARKKARIAEAQAAKAKAREEAEARRVAQNGDQPSSSGVGKQKQKGQNKNRRFYSGGDEFALCNSFAEGKGCVNGDNACKFSHDIKGYLCAKPQDIFVPSPPLPDTAELPLMYGSTRTLSSQQREEFFQQHYRTEAPFIVWPLADPTPEGARQSFVIKDGACPVFHALKSRPIWDASLSSRQDWTPKCPYGFKCRFLGDHHVQAEPGYGDSGIDLPWTYASGVEADPAFHGALDERNFARQGLQKLLRQKKYDLSRTKAVIAALSREEKHWAQTGVDAAGPMVIDFNTTSEPQDESATVQPQTLDEDDMDALMNAGSSSTSAAQARADDAAKSQTASDIDTARTRIPEKRKLDWYHGELYLAPLTTTGNLPFRRVCGTFGSDIHCGEMGLAGSYLEGNKSEWSLVRRWEGEKNFGIQLCGSKPELLVPTAEAMSREFGSNGLDFVDINCGCPIDMVFNHGGGSALLDHPRKLGKIIRGMNAVLEDVPVTIKLRTGITSKNTSHHRIIPRCQTEWNAAAVTMHGRSRKQRYSKRADWDYIRDCVTELRSSVQNWNEAHPDEDELQPIPIYGNGDVYSPQEYYQNLEKTGVDGEMIARGALMKPWIFTEIKERRDWDISSRERLDMVRQFCHYGLMHWGSDTKGVQTTRRFLCEALSFWHRYVPVGLLEYLPPSMNDRPPQYRGRDDLETLLSSDNSADWVKISEMFLGKVKEGEFNFVPKHKSNSYTDSAEQQG